MDSEMMNIEGACVSVRHDINIFMQMHWYNFNQHHKIILPWKMLPIILATLRGSENIFKQI